MIRAEAAPTRWTMGPRATRTSVVASVVALRLVAVDWLPAVSYERTENVYDVFAARPVTGSTRVCTFELAGRSAICWEPWKTRNPARSASPGLDHERSISDAEYGVAVRLGAAGATVSLVPSAAVVAEMCAGV